MKKALIGLLSIKRLIALMLTVTFIYLCVIGLIKPEMFIPIYTMVVGTYFGQSISSDKKNSPGTNNTKSDN